MNDEALTFVIENRRFPMHSVKDYFDLAEALLERDSIQTALMRLDRATLAALSATGSFAERGASVAEIAGRLAEWGAQPVDESSIHNRLEDAAHRLLAEREDHRFALYIAVREQLDAWPALGLPNGPELASAPTPPALAPVPDTDTRFTDRLASEHAFSAVNRVSELIAELNREPAKELQKGGLALPASKRIAFALSTSLAEVPAVISVAARASLIQLEPTGWFPTDEGATWQLAPTADRWRALASAWQSALPPDIRSLLAARAHAAWGDGLREFTTWVYPAGGAWMQARIADYVRDAEALGITAREAPSTPGRLILEDRLDEATAAAAALFPPEVEQVYLQHDLTIVSPGPLTPAIDSRLRTMADVESRALASTYRVSGSSLNRAIAGGESAQSIREFLNRISLGGIPQPLDYLITETADRYGRVRVSEIRQLSASEASSTRSDFGIPAAQSAVFSEDRQLLRTIEVDQSLTSLGLIRTEPSRLVSRFSLDVVFWALTDARYPVVAEDADGSPLSLRRNRPVNPRRSDASDPATELIGRLRSGGELDEAETSGAWLARQLDIAIRGRVPLIVSVGMPDGRIVEYLLEPTGIGGGRLRGRDRGADIERTLPLSSIRSIAPAS